MEGILPTELTALGHQQRKSASAAVKTVEQRMRGSLDAQQQNQLRHLLTSCIDSLKTS